MNTTVKMSSLFDDEGWADGRVVDLSGLEGTNSYCDAVSASVIEKALSDCPLRAIHWIDTGDYHYLSRIFLKRLQIPFSLALFDNHSDSQDSAFGAGILSCGNWVGFLRDGNPFYREYSVGLPVYISIDIDVLGWQWARTNWDQGTMSADELVREVKRIAGESEILGMDICGGLTVPKGALPEDLSVNRRLRERLLSEFSCIFSDREPAL